MIELVKKTIISNNLIKKNGKVLLALSGGPDSVFLFHILNKLKEELRFTLYASHINHMYREDDAYKDEIFVRSLCEQNDVFLYVKRKNVIEYSKELKCSFEEAGRKLRYDFFRQNIEDLDGGVIAVAHNADDQSETVIQRIIRGTGIDGLKAMSYKSNDIIRPILDIDKSSILKYLTEHNYEYCIDYTNSENIYNRNKIRLELIPYIEKNFNPKIKEALNRLSKNVVNDSKIIEKYIDNIYMNVLENNEDKNCGSVVLSINKLEELEDYELDRIFRKAICEINSGLVNVEKKHIDYVLKLLKNNKTGKSIDIGNEICVELSYDKLFIRKNIEKKQNFEYNIFIGKKQFIKEINKYILVEKVCGGCILDGNEYYIDGDKIFGYLKVRNRKDGDKIKPLGMGGTKKIKDIFIDLKVPQAEREKKIILFDDEKIIWIEDYRINRDCKVDCNTQNYLKIVVTNEE